MAKVEREPSAQPVTKMEFEFERRRITKEDVRELIYREILEYHPNMLKEFLDGAEPTGFMYPRFDYLELYLLCDIMFRGDKKGGHGKSNRFGLKLVLFFVWVRLG